MYRFFPATLPRLIEARELNGHPLKREARHLRLCTGTDVEPVLRKTDLHRRVAAAESESLVWEP